MSATFNPLIRLERVRVSYATGNGKIRNVLDGIDLQINCGELICVLGETGCGKSTLLRLLLGQERPTSGKVLIDGKLHDHPDRDRGYVPQKYSLFPDRTVLDNITFGPELEQFSLFRRLLPSYRKARRGFQQQALHLLREVGLQESDACKYPHQLSGGMQQRVAIAQALIMEPKILLMDEAFSALDPATRADMQSLVRRLWAQHRTTILFVTHNIAEAVHLGTRVVILAREAGENGGANVVLDMPLPEPEPEHTPDEWRKSKQFADLVEHLEVNSRRISRRDEAPRATAVGQASTANF